MKARPVSPDLNVICEFEIALRDVCARRDRIREVTARHRDQWPASELPLVDATLRDIERLAVMVAKLRDVLSKTGSSASTGL